MSGQRKTLGRILRCLQQGAALSEFIVVLPALLLLGLGTLQTALIYHAKTTLNYATFEAARKGAMNHAQRAPMREELGLRLGPVFGGDGSVEKALGAITQASLDVRDPRYTEIEILNPTKEAFEDFGEDNPETGQREIPNSHLRWRDKSPGARSQLSIQDANLLKIKVTYGYRLRVPIIREVIAWTLAKTDPEHIQYYAARRLPITSVATLRMQSEAWAEGNGTSPPGGGGGTVPAGQVSQGDSQGGGNLADNTTNPNNTDTHSSANGDGNGAATDTDTDKDELKCEKPAPEEDNQGAQTDEQGIWGSIWNRVKSGLKQGYEFVKGFWEGIKGQLGDLKDLILHPIDTANGLIELGKAFYKDPAGTAKLIGDALGEDWSKLTECAAYDRGKVIGGYANPVFMLKFATQLSKYGNIAEALRTLKIALGCASFSAGTLVATALGPVPIDSLGVGDQVLSRSESSYVDKAQAITGTFGRTVDHYYLLQTEYSDLEVTDEHPFWVQGKGWTKVQDIQPEEVLAGRDIDELVINVIRVDKPLRVYNFSVADTSSYFVGSGLWVHNARCEGSLSRNAGGGLRETLARAGTPVPAGYEAHHLIPVAVAPKFEVMKYAATHLLYIINRPNNGIALPKAPDPAHPELPIHNGSHPNYSDYVEKKLERLEKRYRTKTLTDGQILEEIKKIEDEARADLLNHKVFLDKNDPNIPKS